MIDFNKIENENSFYKLVFGTKDEQVLQACLEHADLSQLEYLTLHAREDRIKSLFSFKLLSRASNKMCLHIALQAIPEIAKDFADKLYPNATPEDCFQMATQAKGDLGDRFADKLYPDATDAQVQALMESGATEYIVKEYASKVLGHPVMNLQNEIRMLIYGINKELALIFAKRVLPLIGSDNCLEILRYAITSEIAEMFLDKFLTFASIDELLYLVRHGRSDKIVKKAGEKLLKLGGVTEWVQIAIDSLDESLSFDALDKLGSEPSFLTEVVKQSRREIIAIEAVKRLLPIATKQTCFDLACYALTDDIALEFANKLLTSKMSRKDCIILLRSGKSYEVCSLFTNRFVFTADELHEIIFNNKDPEIAWFFGSLLLPLATSQQCYDLACKNEVSLAKLFAKRLKDLGDESFYLDMVSHGKTDRIKLDFTRLIASKASLRDCIYYAKHGATKQIRKIFEKYNKDDYYKQFLG